MLHLKVTLFSLCAIHIIMTSSAFKLILFRRITSKIIILSALCYRYFLVSIVSLLHLKNTKGGINKVKEAKVKQAEHHMGEFGVFLLDRASGC